VTSWVNESDALWPLAMALLLQLSLVLLTGIVLQQIIARSAAAKHAVLLWTLVAAALCPVLVVALRTVGVHPLVSLENSIEFPLPLRSSYPMSPLATVSLFSPPKQPLLPRALLLLWAAGALFGMARLSSSLLIVRRLRRAATYLPTERITLLSETIGNRLDGRIPRILFSEQAGIPMALGWWRPVVLLPLSILDRLDDRQLSHVLMHECAHAVRRDAFVGLIQRVLSGVFWFHPLIHLANRLLDRVREEICDNYVLRIGDPRAYSSTLLTVAQSISPTVDGRLAPSLCQPAWSLEDRVAGLLNSRRCLMTKLAPKRSAAIAFGFIGGTLAFSCLAGAPQDQTKPQNDFSHIVQLQKSHSHLGDTITIDEVRGPSDSDEWTVGKTYEVRGTYKLASREKAMLAAFVTISASQRDVHAKSLPDQIVVVAKGEGRFTLRFHMWQEGSPHVSFYPAGGGGASFNSVYF
jgi:beta-lactamase regulating signal transducer with metallopeptidase domain